MMSIGRGRGLGVEQKWDAIGPGGGGFSKFSGHPMLTFLLKKIGFAPWPDTMLSQTLTHLFPMHPFSTRWKHQKTGRI